MSSAVFEEEHLGNFPHAINCASMPFAAPPRPAEHQVLSVIALALVYIVPTYEQRDFMLVNSLIILGMLEPGTLPWA